MTKQFTKLELICERCGWNYGEYEIYKRLLYCGACLVAHKRRERADREDAEWDRAVSPKEDD